VEIKPLRMAGEAARRAWFGLGEEEDFTQRRGGAEESGKVVIQSQTLCHPREGASAWTSPGCPSIVRGTMRPDADPWSDVELENEPCAVLHGQTMDSRLRGNDNGVVDRSESTEADAIVIEPESTEPTPPDDPNIRIIHCKPQPNFPARGMIPPWAERIY